MKPTYTTAELRDYSRSDTDDMLDWAAGEIERLQDIIGRLPTTADGVPVVPGDRIWPLHEIEDETGLQVRFHGYDEPSGEMLIAGDELLIETCYSTREAAEAARQEAVK